MKMWKKCVKSSMKGDGVRFTLYHSTPITWHVPTHFNRDLNIRRIAAKFMTRLLSDDQKQYGICVYKDMQVQAMKERNLLSKVITKH